MNKTIVLAGLSALAVVATGAYFVYVHKKRSATKNVDDEKNTSINVQNFAKSLLELQKSHAQPATISGANFAHGLIDLANKKKDQNDETGPQNNK